MNRLWGNRFGLIGRARPPGAPISGHGYVDPAVTASSSSAEQI